MRIFLRFLSMVYFIGFGLHAADILDLRLAFSEMNATWKVWTVFLMFADAAAAIFLWKGQLFGIRLFQFIALLQIVSYVVLRNIFGNQNFLIIFHLACLVIYTTLSALEAKKETKQSK